jgi:hypothetical protein
VQVPLHEFYNESEAAAYRIPERVRVAMKSQHDSKINTGPGTSLAGDKE